MLTEKALTCAHLITLDCIGVEGSLPAVCCCPRCEFVFICISNSEICELHRYAKVVLDI